MERKGKAIFARFFLLLGLSLLWPGVSQAAECRNQIEILGGSTAILRGEPLLKIEDLQRVMKREKYRNAFRQILDKAKLGSRAEEVLKIVDGLQQKDLHPYAPGTEFEWMAFRYKSNKAKIGC